MNANPALPPEGSHPLSRKATRWLRVLWPSFVMAGVLETLVFAFVDPTTLTWFGGEPVHLSASAVYSLAFLLFWWAIASAGLIAAWLDEAA